MSDERSSRNPALDVASILGESFAGHTMQRVRTPDGRYRYSYVSSGVKDMLGLDPEELVRLPSVDHGWVHDDDRQRFVDALERSADSLGPLDEEVRVRRPDGSYRWVRSLGRPRRLGDGTIVWDGVALDVTERREALEALERALLRVRMKEASDGSFSHIAARDVSNHFAALKQAVDRMAADPEVQGARPVETVVRMFGEFERTLAATQNLVVQQAVASGKGSRTERARLTKRQGEIMDLVAEGLSNRDVAVQLGLSEGTVKLHVSTILKRLGADNRTEAARMWHSGSVR